MKQLQFRSTDGDRASSLIKLQSGTINAEGQSSFVSPKTSRVIPIKHEATRDALILSSLDPDVRAIGYLETYRLDGSDVLVETPIVHRIDGNFGLDIVPARNAQGTPRQKFERVMKTMGLPLLAITRDHLDAQPRRANSHLTWKYRCHPVGISMRMQILQALASEGPMLFGELIQYVRVARDPAPAIMALACSNLLEIDLLTAPIGPKSIVRSLQG